jgi:nucleoside phosphorylase
MRENGNAARARELTDDPMGAALARHILTFDPGSRRLFQLDATTRASLAPIPWPKGLAPTPIAPPRGIGEEDPLPKADALVVTWTVAETRALADVLTPGVSSDAWLTYRHRFEDFYRARLRRGAPALLADHGRGLLGLYSLAKIGTRKVLCMKSDLHLSQDGTKLPVRDLWKQIIEETGAKLVITTGTAGAVGADVQLGDVVVTPHVRFDCQRDFKRTPFAQATFSNSHAVPSSYFRTANGKLIPANASQLPPAPRTPRILTGTSAKPIDVLTTDFFAFDDNTNDYGLRTTDPQARAVEMGDAVLGLVCKEDLANPPSWFVVRNASDPQIGGNGTLREKAAEAARIYERYGYWTTVGSAIASWAIVAAEQA